MRRAAPLLWVAVAACGAPPTEQRSYEQFKPPSVGVQLESPEFVVPAQSEATRCITLKVPSSVDLDVKAFSSVMRSGSHHMNMFLSPRDEYPDGVGPCAWDDMATYEYVYATQEPYAEAILPENVAIKFPAGAQVVIQSHYVNPNDAAITGQIKVNMTAFETGATKIIYAAAFAALNLDISIPPKSTKLETRTCILSSSKSYRIIGFAPHTHSRCATFEVYAHDGQTAGDKLYRSDDWAHPPYRYFQPPYLLSAGAGFQYTCTFLNDTDRTLVWGNSVDQEMCMMVGYYYPSDGSIICL